MQLSLLDQLPPEPNQGFQNAQRRDLGNGAWVEYVPDWLSGHHQVLERLLHTADWESHRRVMYDRIVDVPRLVAGMPGGGSFSWRDGEVVRAPTRAPRDQVDQANDELARMAALLSIRYRRVLDSVTLAHYRDGRDSVAFHGDKMGKLRADTVVAIVSVGGRRNFLMRPSPHAPPLARRQTLSYRFGEGDLLVMGGTAQETWEHGVPKMAHAGKRIAIMFRETIPQPVAARSPGSSAHDVRRAREQRRRA